MGDASDYESVPAQQEYLFKILVVGDYAVGKTSLIRRYTDGYFSDNYKLTLGVDFALKTVDVNCDTKINLQLWDIAGNERFGNMTSVYYKYAIAALVVFDVGRDATFDGVQKWLEDIKSKVTMTDGGPIPVVLMANKCDVKSTYKSLDTAKLNSFCHQHDIISWFPSSAKDNLNVDESVNFLIGHILSTKEHILNSGLHNGISHSLKLSKDKKENTQAKADYKCC